MDDGAVRDLLAWYVIAWLGESLRNTLIVERLVEKTGEYSPEDLQSLLKFVAEAIEGLLPRYRALAESGAVELSVSPYAHPILPLMLDFESARDAIPEVMLPKDAYPGGEARCNWHLAEAVRCFRDTFGHAPAGCWPSEGALSQETLQALGRHEFRWTASGSQVLHNSLRREGRDDTPLPQLQTWQPGDDGLPVCFFRDDGLSDLIGFEYSNWQAEDAVGDFIARLESLREESLRHGNRRPVLGIIMDGENAWEYFVENGWDFLQGLYLRLAEHPDFHLTTFSDALEHVELQALPELCAGSWVYGNFSTWVGESGKNLAWEMLAAAKRAVDAALEQNGHRNETAWNRQVLRQLAICEASDWFWWLGESNQLVDGPEFENMFRIQLCALYRMLDMDLPPDLAKPSGDLLRDERQPFADTSGAMRRSGAPEAVD
jgi:alpha-amylase/alpha-mannosidase (GH57 family)